MNSKKESMIREAKTKTKKQKKQKKPDIHITLAERFELINSVFWGQGFVVVVTRRCGLALGFDVFGDVRRKTTEYQLKTAKQKVTWGMNKLCTKYFGLLRF